jgi:hypothetical protein
LVAWGGVPSATAFASLHGRRCGGDRFRDVQCDFQFVRLVYAYDESQHVPNLGYGSGAFLNFGNVILQSKKRFEGFLERSFVANLDHRRSVKQVRHMPRPRKSKWKFKTSSGAAISFDFVGAQKSSFTLENGGGFVQKFDYAAAGAGLSIGPPTKVLDQKPPSIGASGSTEDYWSVGSIYLTEGFPKEELDVSDVEGLCQIFEAGASAYIGITGTFMALGIPTDRMPMQLWHNSLIGMGAHYLGVDKELGGDGLTNEASALLFMAGANSGPNVSAGFMDSYGYVWAGDAGIDFSPPVSHDHELVFHATSRDLIYLPEDVLFAFDHHDFEDGRDYGSKQRAPARSEAHRLKPGAMEALQALKRQLEFMKPSWISVEGHTDVIGPDDYNYTLSYRRAWAVAEWLIANTTFTAARISIVGFGKTRPIRSNTSHNAYDPKVRAKDRRVEVRLHW